MIPRNPRSNRPHPGSRTYIAWCMKRWLSAAGIHHCFRCNRWGHDVPAKRRQCLNCGREHAQRVYQLKKLGMWQPYGQPNPGHEPDTDWGPKANAYFESQVDPFYYSGVQVQYQSPIASLTMRASLKPHASTGVRRSMA